MPIIQKTLAQVNIGATTLTILYTAPYASAAEQAALTGLDMAASMNRAKATQGTRCDQVMVCNTGAAGTIRLSYAPAAAANNIKQYYYYDTPIAANSSLLLAMPIWLVATDVIRGYASSANFSFNLLGAEAQY